MSPSAGQFPMATIVVITKAGRRWTVPPRPAMVLAVVL
jgi:hypothetical protein